MFSKLLVEGALSIRRRLVRDRNISPGSGGVRHTAAPMNKPGYTRTASPLLGADCMHGIGSPRGRSPSSVSVTVQNLIIKPNSRVSPSSHFAGLCLVAYTVGDRSTGPCLVLARQPRL
jgi:hypothetical protein